MFVPTAELQDLNAGAFFIRCVGVPVRFSFLTEMCRFRVNSLANKSIAKNRQLHDGFWQQGRL